MGLGLIFLFLLFALAPFYAVAQDYDYEINAYAVYFEVSTPQEVRETIEMDITAHTNLSQYVIYTDYPVEDARAVIDLGGSVEVVNVTVREVLGGTNAIYMSFPRLKPGQNARISLSFTTRGMIAESDGKL